ncbi:TauD/TfdA family dioxygenase [Kineobactrum sediminis]|uniref:TauD/TfdA family dioxygenase n=1 Tax=Kineobactrum sediminis TaxID=1905677 RepID=A0A2N5Y1U1_9GAMM|nr:TauD/TfdA family dioxygenase [Kineobactrum sediminis]PLW82361.1 TauD/TfdA family dioxygenase [Kineobactrum sediminis]
MSFTIDPLCEQFGVAVSGLDFNVAISDAEKHQLQSLWLEHGIMLIRGSNVSPQAQIEFSKLFGDIEAHPLESIRSKEYPELMELNSEDERMNPVSWWHGEPVIGRLPWHKDLIYTAKPNRGAILRAVVLPEHDGETGFGDQSKAYDALSEDMKARIDGLEVVYRFEVNLLSMPFLDTRDYRPGAGAPKTPAEAGFPDFPDSLYPLVFVHPETGRKSLNVCPMFMDHLHNVDKDESDALLQELVEHVVRPEFTYLHKWQTGDMVLWDNWRFMHSAPGIRPGDKRLIHRTTITGDRVLGKTLAA